MESRPHIRKQRVACESCRRRKVRCDIETTTADSCMQCTRSGSFCTTRTDWPAPKRRKDDHGTALTRIASVSSQPESGPYRTPRSINTTSEDISDPSANDPGAQHSDNPARTSLSRFFKDGVASSGWGAFDVDGTFRLVYVGSSVSNLSHLVQFRLDSLPVASHEPKSIHFPYPQVRLPQGWAAKHPDHSLGEASPVASSLTENESNDHGSSLPMAELREALVKAYFNLIHPVFPVVDQSQFLDEQGELTTELPPPLLYQAVLLVGAHVCTHPLVSKDRWALKAVLFRRASMLYHLREETDRLYLTQAALLFTWHIHDGDTVAGGPWYWTGIAVRLNYGQGTHRHNSLLPTREHALHKRLWWSTFVLEVFAALELGRPCGVHWEGSDQQLLTDQDLNYGRPCSGQQACETSTCTSPNDMTVADYHAGFVRLAYIGIDVGRMGFQAGSSTLTVSSIDSRLAAWMLQTRLSSPMLDEGFLKRHLRLHYHLLVLFLHRMYVQKSDVSRSACSLASDSILHILDMLRAHDEMPRCHSTIVTVVTAVGIQVVSDLRSALAINAHLTAMALLDRLARVIQHTKSLIPLWPNAEAVYNIFESLHKDYQALVTQSHATGFSETTVAVPESLLDWPALFMSHSANEDTQIHSPDLRWAELLDWTEGL